ncbi:DUF6086 family protein [Streptomyces roseoverticillatus]|uniref:DUF6086 family protein n=1 Tax=Streptomyces roseoverticillatus TaxID=66429 RepID=A0ABV3IML2_9ACTN
MSQIFEVAGNVLWHPSNGPARLFLRQVPVFEAEVKGPSGVGPMVNDECQIDPAAFRNFVDALLRWYRATHHPVMTAMAEGFICTALVLAERAGLELRWYAPDQTYDHLKPSDAQTERALAAALNGRMGDLRERAREHGRSMVM